jgi:two-component system chemotaxis response regulator CheY
MPTLDKEKQQRILVVDDNQAMRKMIESMLTTLGFFNIASAVNGEAAWDKVISDDIDIIISDLIMPNLDGLGFLCRLRESKEYFNIPFIMVTGADQRSDFINTVQSEVDFYLIKPITPKVLEDALHQVYLQQHSSNPYLQAVHSGKHNIIHENYAEAKDHFSLAQSLEPGFAKPYFFLGKISILMEQEKEAESYFKKCLEIEEHYINAIIELADIYTKRNDFKNMLLYLNRAIEVSPGNFQLFVNIGTAYFNLNKLAEAKKYLLKAAKLARSGKKDVQVVVDAMIDASLLDEADYLYGTRLQDEDDNTVKFWNRLGLKAKGLGWFDKAKHFYMAALKIRPQNKVINFNMALLLVEQKEYDGALAYISKALRLHPDFKAGHELKDAIKQLNNR